MVEMAQEDAAPLLGGQQPALRELIDETVAAPAKRTRTRAAAVAPPPDEIDL